MENNDEGSTPRAIFIRLITCFFADVVRNFTNNRFATGQMKSMQGAGYIVFIKNIFWAVK